MGIYCSNWKKNLINLEKYNPYAKSLLSANVAIIVLGNKKRMRYPQYFQQDLGAACQNILLQATALNIGSVWLGTAPDESRMNYISKLYELSDDLLPFAVIAIGYPENESANSFIDRFDPSRVTYIK